MKLFLGFAITPVSPALDVWRSREREGERDRGVLASDAQQQRSHYLFCYHLN